MQRSFMLSISAAVMLCLGNAAAIAAELSGTFGSTGINTCLVASSGFNAILQAIGTTYSVSSAAEGVITFNRDGKTGTFSQNSTTIVPPPTVGFPPGASSSQSSGSITFTVTDDTFTVQTVPGTDVGKVLTGPRAGQTFKIEGTPNRTGIISADRRSLISSILTPGVETLTYSNGDVELRICYLQRVEIKLDAD
jgi:hypothetical protein